MAWSMDGEQVRVDGGDCCEANTARYVITTQSATHEEFVPSPNFF